MNYNIRFMNSDILIVKSISKNPTYINDIVDVWRKDYIICYLLIPIGKYKLPDGKVNKYVGIDYFLSRCNSNNIPLKSEKLYNYYVIMEYPKLFIYKYDGKSNNIFDEVIEFKNNIPVLNNFSLDINSENAIILINNPGLEYFYSIYPGKIIKTPNIRFSIRRDDSKLYDNHKFVGNLIDVETGYPILGNLDNYIISQKED